MEGSGQYTRDRMFARVWVQVGMCTKNIPVLCSYSSLLMLSVIAADSEAPVHLTWLHVFPGKASRNTAASDTAHFPNSPKLSLCPHGKAKTVPCQWSQRSLLMSTMLILDNTQAKDGN